MNSGMNIKMGEEEVEKLQIGLDSKEKFSIKAKDGKRFEFSPRNNDIIVKELGMTSKYPDGIIMNEKDRMAILDFIA
jgi:hypothetical protein